MGTKLSKIEKSATVVMSKNAVILAVTRQEKLE